MDLTLFFRVVWRYRLLVLSGLILAVLAALLSLVRISPGSSPAVSLRGSGEYVSYTTIFVTQRGFPWGRLPVANPDPSVSGGVDAAKLAALATLYTKLADSDPVQNLNKAVLPEKGWELEAAPVLDGGGLNQPLPLIRIAAIANSPALAEQAAGTAADSLMTYVSQNQRRAGIPYKDRVVLQLIKGPEEAKTLSGRPLTKPIVLFLLITLLTLAAPFVIDNVRRSARAVREENRPADGSPSGIAAPLPVRTAGEVPAEADADRRRRIDQTAEERRRIAELSREA